MRSDSIYIIIPVFNERQTIKQVVESLLVLEYNIVIVDDGSTDATRDCVNDLPVFYLKHEINLGQGAALQTGIEFALQRDAEILISFDGDGQHQAADLVNLIKPLVLREANVVLGSRFLPASITNIPFLKKQAILLARVIHYLFTGLWLSDAHNGLRAFDRKAASVLDLKENRMAHASEILFKLHQHEFRIKEVPVSILYSEYSKSKGQSVFSGIKIFFDILLNRIFE